MIPADFYNAVWAKEVVLEALGLTIAPLDIDARLEATAGKDAEGTKAYRPDYLCAEYLDVRDTKQSPLGTKNVSLRDYDKRIAGYLKRQAALDTAFGLTIPPGVSAALPTRPNYMSVAPVVVTF